MTLEDLKAIVGIAEPEALAKNLPAAVRGLRMAAPKYSAEQIEGPAQMALAHGAIDAETAATIQSALNLAGPHGVPAALIRALEGNG